MWAVTAAVTAALALASSCQGYNLTVKASGGNVTTNMMYGIMHEVDLSRQFSEVKTNPC